MHYGEVIEHYRQSQVQKLFIAGALSKGILQSYDLLFLPCLLAAMNRIGPSMVNSVDTGPKQQEGQVTTD